jgi:hypothetical protein
VDAVVSLAGAPVLGDQPLPKQRPRLVVVSQTGDAVNLANVAIVPCLTRSAAASADPKTPREWFDFTYEVVTPANVATQLK